MPVGDVLKLRIITHRSDINQLGLIIRHYRVAAVVAPEATPVQIAINLETLFAADMISLMTSAARFRGVGVQKVFPLPMTVETFSATLAANGSIGGDPLPPQVAGLVTLRTALAGRRFRGRAYTPFPAETSSNGTGVPTAGYLVLLNILALDLFTVRVVPNGAGSSTLQPVIFRRSTGTTTDITNTVARDVWATQRRRGRFGAANPPPV